MLGKEMIEQLPIDETVYNWIVGIFGYGVECWLIMYIIGMNDREVDDDGHRETTKEI